jgi:hypothetical protein
LSKSTEGEDWNDEKIILLQGLSFVEQL